IRLGHSKFFKEDVRHPLVIMLPGVDEKLRYPSTPCFIDDWSHLHEIGARTDNSTDHLEAFLPVRDETVSSFVSMGGLDCRSPAVAAEFCAAVGIVLHFAKCVNEFSYVSWFNGEARAISSDDICCFSFRYQHNGYGACHRLVYF